jgi:hypothetical protein
MVAGVENRVIVKRTKSEDRHDSIGGLENRICQIWCEGTHNDLENRWLESMPSEYIASYKPTDYRSACPYLDYFQFADSTGVKACSR